MLIPPEQEALPVARQPKKPARSSRSQKSKAAADQPEPAADKDDEDDEDDSQSSSDGENGEKNADGSYDMDGSSVFGRQWGSAPEHVALQSAMRNIHGQITRTMQELRVILENLRQKDDPTLQRAALEELAQVLLMANEDTLAGHFAPDPYIKELIPLMQADENGEENPEMMLIACRCIANMMEALPACAQNVVYGGAVPILCQKLLEIHYIDLAEQAISVGAPIRVDLANLCRPLKRSRPNFQRASFARAA
jgi:E3 ubiquitin-protein ligase TRIP12